MFTIGDLSLYRDRVYMYPQVKFQSRIVRPINKLRHPVVKVSIAEQARQQIDKGSKSRERQ